MRIALRSALVLAAFGASSAVCAAPKDPTGTWLTEDGRAKIRLDRCGPGAANVCGKVVWMRVPNGPDGNPMLDQKNPDPKKRGRPILGLQIITGLKPADDRFAGEIYKADEGKIYQVELERESEGKLSISGCLLGLLCGSQTWSRVPDVNQQAAVSAAKPSPARDRATLPAAATAE